MRGKCYICGIRCIEAKYFRHICGRRRWQFHYDPQEW